MEARSGAARRGARVWELAVRAALAGPGVAEAVARLPAAIGGVVQAAPVGVRADGARRPRRAGAGPASATGHPRAAPLAKAAVASARDRPALAPPLVRGAGAPPAPALTARRRIAGAGRAARAARPPRRHPLTAPSTPGAPRPKYHAAAAMTRGAGRVGLPTLACPRLDIAVAIARVTQGPLDRGWVNAA